MTERTPKDQRLTTADIAHSERSADPGSPPVSPRVPADRTERPIDVRTGEPLPRGSAERAERPTDVRLGPPVPRGPAERMEAADGRMGASGSPEAQQAGPLFSGEESRGLLSQWNSIQTGFVDEPRKAVKDADALVATTVKRLAEIFADERSRLEGQWGRGDQVSTEDLRVALQRYRSFFTRLLSV